MAKTLCLLFFVTDGTNGGPTNPRGKRHQCRWRVLCCLGMTECQEDANKYWQILKTFSPNVHTLVTLIARELLVGRFENVTNFNLLYLVNVHFSKVLEEDILYFSIDNAHLMYNAHPKLFLHSF
jgi:hypothetical protein